MLNARVSALSAGHQTAVNFFVLFWDFMLEHLFLETVPSRHRAREGRKGVAQRDTEASSDVWHLPEELAERERADVALQ